MEDSSLNPNLNTTKSIPQEDKLNHSKTIYDASISQIMWKNFLAGLMRGLGSIIIWFFFMIIMFNIFLSYFWPQLKPFVDLYQQALSNLNTFEQATTNPSSIQVDENTINSILEKFQSPSEKY
jgi:hypothetical protein